MIRLVVGLGNPGPEYRDTRHNAGFWLVDELSEMLRAPLRDEPRFFGSHARARSAGEAVSLLEPGCFMNRSGQSVGACAGFYKIPPDEILVVHDELDLPPGAVRLKRGGGHGGHNGLRDITRVIGADFHRLRVGIGHPGSADRVTPWVLGRPTADDERHIRGAIGRALQCLPDILRGEFQRAMNSLHASN